MKQFKDIGPDEFNEGMKDEANAGLIDVRTPGEYEDAHIPGAKLINIMSPDFASEIDNLERDKAYYVYCRSGSRSAAACQYMASRGFKELYNLEDGILSWRFEMDSGD